MTTDRVLYVPGNDHIMLRDAVRYPAEAILFDLEDGVPPGEKDEARLLVYHALSEYDYPEDTILIVNINPLRGGVGVVDLELIVRAEKAIIRLPKVQSAHEVQNCELEIERIERRGGLQIGSTRMMAAIECARGALHAQEIAEASPRLVGIAVGAQRFLTAEDFGGEPAARGAAEGDDFENASRSDTRTATANSAHFLHEIYTPTPREIQQAREVLAAVEQLRQEVAHGPATLQEALCDYPLLARAKRVLKLARDADMPTRTEPM